MRRRFEDDEGGGGGGGGGPVAPLPEPTPDPPDVPTSPRQPDEDRQIPNDPPPPPRHPSGRQIPEDPDTTFPDFPEAPDPPGPPTYSNAPSERQISSPATIFDQVIPMVYGSAKVNGYCAGWNVSGNFLSMAFVFCFGEQAGIGSIKVNSESIGSATPWIISNDSFLGTGSGSRPTYMAWMATDYWNYLMNFCCLTIRVNLIQAQTPGGFQVTAVPTGRKFASFQSPYTVSNYTNPAEVAYDILTSAEWKGLSSPADTGTGGTWEKLFGWWDDDMGDATKRFSFNGVLDTRDPDAALDTVLGSGFAQKYFSSDGVVKLWGEMKPPAISGTWTASGSSTLSGSGGDASNELESNEIIYAGDTPCIVINTSGADTIYVDRAITITAELVRKTSSVWIKKDDWVKMPSGQEAETGSIPDTVRVRYTLPANWGSATYPENLSPGDEKRVEVTVPGCDNASMARRISEMKKNIVEDQPLMWSGVAGGIASSLEPGDIFFFDDDGTFEFQPARVLPPIHQTSGGNVGMQFRQYSPDVVSENTQADPSVPATPSGYVSGDTPHFSAINAVNTSGVAYNFMRWNGTDMNVGSTVRVTVLDGISIRLPNNIALLGLKFLGGTPPYVELLKVNASDQIQLGDGTIPIYLNSTNLIMDQGVAIQSRLDSTSIVDVIKIVTGDSLICGNVSSVFKFIGTAAIGGCDLFMDGGNIIMGAARQFRMRLTSNPSIQTTVAEVIATDLCVLGGSTTALTLQGTATRPKYASAGPPGVDLALFSDIGGGGGSDTDAIHDNIANEITAITAKTSPVDADEIIIEDSAASFVKKSVTLANLSGYIESDLGGPFLPLSAGVGEPLTGDLHLNEELYFEYGKAVHMKDSGGIHRDVLYTAASGRLYFGDQANLRLDLWGNTTRPYYNSFELARLADVSAVTFLDLTDTPSAYTAAGQYAVRVNSGLSGLSFATSADTYFGGRVILDKNVGFGIRDSGDTIRELLDFDSNVLTIGHISYQTYIQGSGTVLCNDHFGINGAFHMQLGTAGASFLQQEDASTWRNLIGMVSYETVVGNTSHRTRLESNGAIYVEGTATVLSFETSAGVYTQFLRVSGGDCVVGNTVGDLVLLGTGTRPTYGGVDLALFSDIGGGGSDVDAIHDNVANEITAITAKTSVVDADEFVIEDSAASYVKKSVTLANLKTYIGSGAGSDTDAIHVNVANEITGIATKATPIDADEFVIEDSAASYVKKSVTLSQLANNYLDAELAAYFAALSHTHTESDITDLDHTDTAAIHDNVANEITAITAKTSPVDADEILIEDSGAAFVKKSVTLANLSSYIESDLGGPFLPLTAGSGEVLTGTLYAQDTTVGSTGVQVNTAGSGNRYAYLDLIGDDTYTDYGLRIIRNNTGLNATSIIQHRGTGALRLVTLEAAAIGLYTSNTLRVTIESDGDVVTTQDMYFEYGKKLYMRDSVGTHRDILYTATSSRLFLGDQANLRLDLWGNTTRPYYNGSELARMSDISAVAFLDLTDTPSSYSGAGQYAVRVNAGTGLEFATAGDTYFGGSVVLDKNLGFYIRDSGDAAREILDFDSNIVNVGHASYVMNLWAATEIKVNQHLEMQGSYDLRLGSRGTSQLEQWDGAAWRNLITMDSATDTFIGNTAGRVVLESNGSVRIKGLATGIYMETSAGAFSSMFLLSSTILTVGNANRNLLLYCNTEIDVIGGNLMLNANDLDTEGGDILLGGGKLWTEGGDIETGTTSGGDVRIGTGGKVMMRNSSGSWIDMVSIVSDLRVFGQTSTTTWVEGNPLKLYTHGYSGTSSPTTGIWNTVGSWGIHVETDVSKVYLVYNHGGTIKKVELT